MILTNILLQIGIVIGVIVLFLVTYILNKKTKVPKRIEIPDKCQSCASSTCMIKTTDIKQMKAEIKQQMEKDCENKEQIDDNEEK